jgi:hypothetical protein
VFEQHELVEGAHVVEQINAFAIQHRQQVDIKITLWVRRQWPSLRTRTGLSSRPMIVSKAPSCSLITV